MIFLGFSLDHILEDKDFNMDTFSTADLHSEQHFIHTDSQTHHIVQEQHIPTTSHQVQVSNNRITTRMITSMGSKVK